MNKKIVVWNKILGRDETIKKWCGIQPKEDDKLLLTEIPNNQSVTSMKFIIDGILFSMIACLIMGVILDNNPLCYLSALLGILCVMLYSFIVVDKGVVFVERPNDYKEGDVVIPEIAGTTIIGVKKL